MSDNNKNGLGELYNLFAEDKEHDTTAKIAGSSGGSSDIPGQEQELAVGIRRRNAQAEIYQTSNQKSKRRFRRAEYTSAILAENHNKHQHQHQQ